MNFLTDDVKVLYRRFLSASVFSALVISIYSFADTIAVGQSEGSLGAAAMAVVTPLYSFYIFFAVLIGIGGSVLMSNAKGAGDEERGNAYFSIAAVLMLAVTALLWLFSELFAEPLMRFFGANDELLPKVMEYAAYIIRFSPVFIATSFLAAFIRNDGAPALAMKAVLIGGAVNMFLDWFLVFPLGMKMRGAAMASVIGASVQTLIMCAHFFGPKCRLRLVRPFHPQHGLRNLIVIGFGASTLELGVVTIPIMTNHQILRFAGTTELAVYGVVATVFALFQELFCGVGQAIQPLVSANHGAGLQERVARFRQMSFRTVLLLGAFFVCLGELFPVPIMRLFVRVTPDIVNAAPLSFRLFFPLFLPLGVTVLSTYYFQSLMRDRISLLTALLHSLLLSGLLLFALPPLLGVNGVWLALPLAEALTAAFALYYTKKRCL